MKKKTLIDNALLFIIFSVVGTLVFSNGLLNSHGFLSPDSTHYLALAQSLLNNEASIVGGDSSLIDITRHMAVWPIGYPLVIFWIAKILGISVFISSKIANLIFFAGSLMIVKRLFSERTVLYGLILCFGSYLQIFSYSWSEAPFVFSLLWFGHSIIRYLETQKYCWWFSLVFSMLSLFLFRYVGAFSLLVVGLIILADVKQKQFNRIVPLLLACTVVAICISIYLYNNYLETGWITGRQRVAAFESIAGLALMTAKGILQEFGLIIGYQPRIFWMALVIQMVLVLSVLFYTRRQIAMSAVNAVMQINPKNTFGKNEGLLVDGDQSFFDHETRKATVFLMIGVCYCFCIILLRWISHFDNLNARLLSPGVLLLLFGLVNLIDLRGRLLWRKALPKIIASFAIASLLIAFLEDANPPVSGANKANITYQQQLDLIKKKYAAVSAGDIVIFGNIHMRYLNTQLIIKRPFSHPLDKSKTSFNDYLKNIKDHYPATPIFIDLEQARLRCSRLHASWCEYVASIPNNVLMRLQ